MPPQITCASTLPGKRGNKKIPYFTQLDCVTHIAPVCYLPERKMSSVMCLIVSNICWDSKIFHWYCPLTFTPGLTKNKSHLLHSDWQRDRLG